MKVKEFKNRKVINVKISAFTDDHEKIIEMLNAVGIGVIHVESCSLRCKASLKQLLQLEELGLNLSNHNVEINVMGKM